jgi:L-aminopeptidase/D-esterase-like protein
MKRREFVASIATAAGLGRKAADAMQQTKPSGSITDVEGIKVGHFTETRRPTGCTVVLTEEGAVAGVDVRGGAPGTRETDLLSPVNTVSQVNAILLSGGHAALHPHPAADRLERRLALGDPGRRQPGSAGVTPADMDRLGGGFVLVGLAPVPVGELIPAD